jgi:hypothetical protein
MYGGIRRRLAKIKPISALTLLYRDTCIVLLSMGPAMLVNPSRFLASLANLGKLQKIEGKDLPNVRHLCRNPFIEPVHLTL